jgi:DNA replication protein DnaC
MVQAFQDHLAMPKTQRYEVNELVAHLAEMEYLHQSSKRTELFIELSKLRYDAVFEQVECSAERNLTRQQLNALSEASCKKGAENVLITGATGCGKSYLVCAIGKKACMYGIKT